MIQSLPLPPKIKHWLSEPGNQALTVAVAGMVAVGASVIFDPFPPAQVKTSRAVDGLGCVVTATPPRTAEEAASAVAAHNDCVKALRVRLAAKGIAAGVIAAVEEAL